MNISRTAREVPRGCYDVAVLSALVQVLCPEDAQATLKNVSRVIRPGGRIFIRGYGILDDCRTSPYTAVALNLVFINLYDGIRHTPNRNTGID